MLVEPQDGRCRKCGGQRQIVGAIHDSPTFMAEQLGAGGEP